MGIPTGRQEQAAARQLFLRLVAVTEDGERGRRRVTAAELLQLGLDTVDLQQAIDGFAKHRLLTLDRSPTTGEPTVEVAHEALLSEWDRLREWIDDARHDIRRYAVLSVAVDEWVRSDRDADYLWQGRRLGAVNVVELDDRELAIALGAAPIEERHPRVGGRVDEPGLGVEGPGGAVAVHRLWRPVLSRLPAERYEVRSMLGADLDEEEEKR